MKVGRRGRAAGFSLIEAVVSVGVLAVAAPLVLAAMIRAGESSALARAESRSPAMVAVCLSEIELARTDGGGLLDPIPAGGSFPAGDGLAAIGFTPEGRPVGRVEAEDYEQGTRSLAGETLGYVVRIDGEPETVRSDGRPMRSVRIAVEFPAPLPAERRRVLEFYSRMP
jgi:type II secretory pathway pseudopilin PulG